MGTHDEILLPSVGVQAHTTRAKAGDWYVFVELCDVPVVGFSKDSSDPLKVICRSGDGLKKSHKWNSLFTFGISGAVR